jgi:hypothetical protein
MDYFELTDYLRIVHAALAVTVVFPIIGITCYFAWSTRQRRLKLAGGEKTTIAPVVGLEHAKLGRVLTSAVVGLSLIGFMHPIFKNILKNRTWDSAPFKATFIVAMFALTVAALVCLYVATKGGQKLWRGIFATLTGAGVVILGFQDGIFRRDDVWYLSHFYSGLSVTMLMIFSLAILPDIYLDRSQRWRKVHAAINSIALLLFIFQGMSGVRDLLEVPLTWQEPYIYQCGFAKDQPNFKTCPGGAKSEVLTAPRFAAQPLFEESHLEESHPER